MTEACPARWLESVAAFCLGSGPDDCRLGDLSEHYGRSRARLQETFGGSPGARLAARLAADIGYLLTMLNVMLFVRVVDPGLRRAESGAAAFVALDLRERIMAMLQVSVRRFALPALLLLCGALLVTGAIDGWNRAQQTEAMMASAQRAKAELAAQRIVGFVTEIQRQIGWVAYAQFGALPVGQRRFDYVRLLRQVPAITELSQLDRDGHEQLNVSRLAMDVVDSAKDRSGEPAFAAAKANQPYVGPVYFRKASEPYATMAMRHGATWSGVTIAEINLKLIWDTIANLNVEDGGYGYVVDGSGRLIAHPDFKFVPRQPNLKDRPQVAAALAGTADGLTEGRSFYPEGPGIAVLSAAVPVQGLDWKVIVDVPADAYAVPFRNAVIRSVAMAGLGLVAMILAFVLALRPIAGPRPAQA